MGMMNPMMMHGMGMGMNPMMMSPGYANMGAYPTPWAKKPDAAPDGKGKGGNNYHFHIYDGGKKPDDQKKEAAMMDHFHFHLYGKDGQEESIKEMRDLGKEKDAEIKAQEKNAVDNAYADLLDMYYYDDDDEFNGRRLLDRYYDDYADYEEDGLYDDYGYAYDD